MQTNTEFIKFMDTVSSQKNGKLMLDTKKIASLPDATKDTALNIIVRKMLPVVVEFIRPEKLDWLHSMGYLYSFSNKAGYSFLGTCAQKVRNDLPGNLK